MQIGQASTGREDDHASDPLAPAGATYTIGREASVKVG
jgi:hypothetical protein